MRLPAVLVVLAIVEGLAWSVVQPPLADPTERTQVAYAQHFAETGRKPDALHGSAPESSQQARYARVSGTDALLLGAGRPAYRDIQRRVLAQTLPATGTRRDDGAGFNRAALNPPGMPALDAVPYYLVRVVGGSFGMTVVVLRLIDVALFALAVWLTWLLALELLGGRRAGAAMAAATVTLLPGLSARAGLVSIEPLLTAELAATVLMALRLVRLGPTPMRAAVLAACVVAGVLTSGRGLVLAVPAAIAAVVVLRRPASRSALAPGAIAAAAVLVVGAALVALTSRGNGIYGGVISGELKHPSIKTLVSWTWQQYFPPVGGMNPQAAPHGLRHSTLAGLLDPPTAGFGHLALTLGVVALLALLCILVRAAWARRAGPIAPGAVIAVATVLAMIVAVDIWQVHVPTEASVPLGVVLLPLAPLLGCSIGFAAETLRARAATWLVGTTVAVGVLAQLGALYIVAERFHG